ncbi:GtrA family protein [Campylobacter jejuni]|uniref:GtrA family protein n=1 Tax=Campylobacter jejuni TaxID=197 RepID=UPI002043DAB1
MIFRRYISIGVLNTIIHWFIFFICFYFLQITQAWSNFMAFCVAVTFSFLANSKWTFESKANWIKYISFTAFMGCLALFLGYVADKLNFPTIVTLVSFSFISLFIGFLYSKYVVFKVKNK